MHNPRDEFERELYGDTPTGATRIAPVWQLLALTMVAYIIAGILVLSIRSAELSADEFRSVMLFGGLVVTLGSGIFTG